MTDEDREFVDFFADEYWPLRRLGFLLTGNWHEADELAQEATARTFAAWGRLRRRSGAAAYARKILVNRHRSLLRRALVEARHAVVHREQRYEPDLSGDSQLLWQALQQLPVRQRTAGVLAEVVATEPPPERSPFEQIARRRRRRPLIAATVALALLLVAAVAVTGIRAFEERPVRPTSTVVPPDWKEFRDQEADLSFRYPPDWVVRTDLASAAYLVIVPAEFRDRRVTKSPELPFAVGVSGGGAGGAEGYYRMAAGEQATTGRLPNGRAYTGWTSVVDGRRYRDYSIDVGRVCPPGSSPPNCGGAHSIRVTLAADTAALMDRYQQVAMAIVGTLAPLSATTPSVGDRARPPCRADQWGLVPSPISSFQGRSWTIEGQVRYPADGPACHLRVTVRVTVQRPDRTPMAVPGTPAPITIEGDLPEDRAPTSYSKSYADMTTPLTWRWAWQNWCRQPLGRTRVRIEAVGTGKSATVQAPLRETYTNCKGLGRDAPWRISPWP